jgi:hypothetical protein
LTGYRTLIDELCDEAASDEPAWHKFNAAPVVAMASNALHIKSHCESPIEVQLGARLMLWLPILFPEYGCSLCPDGHQQDFPATRLLLIPQYCRGRFRFDFAIERLRTVLVFIECDGQEFHSNPKQIAADKRRDEAAARDGVSVLRFSGSRIYRWPDECVRDIGWHVRSLLEKAA